MTVPMSVNVKNKETQKSQSQWSIVWRQFSKNPLARVGLSILAFLYLLAIFAGFLAPYGLSQYSTDASDRVSWSPPTKIHWKDDQGKLTGPYIYVSKRQLSLETFRDEYQEDTAIKYPIRFFVSSPDTIPYKFLGLFGTKLKLLSVNAPAKLYLWGSDNLGRDQFSRVMYGAQISLTIGILATLVSLILGLILGGIAGFYGGIWDTIIMRIVEVINSIPGLFLLITLRAVFPQSMNPLLVFFIVICMLAFIGWGSLARVVRAQVLSAREQDYVSAATALGASDARIIARHLLPNTATYIIISISLLIPGFILEESALSFIGIGVVEPYASWGSLLKMAQDGGFESITGRPWVLIPGIFIFLAVLGWQFVGDGLRDAFDPRKRQ